MRFIFRMAAREARSSWRRLVFFFVCIAFGVGSIVAVRSVIRNFNRVLTSDARAILGADISVSSGRPWKEQTLLKIEKITGKSIQARAESIEADTMLRTTDPSKPGAMLVELHGIDPPYPFYGDFSLADGKPFQHQLLVNDGLLVDQSVLERLNLKTGDTVKMGTKAFVIRGVIDREPGASSNFRFGPIALTNRKAVEDAGIAGFGSRSRRRIMLKIPEERVASTTDLLKKSLKDDFVRVRSYKDSQDRMNERFTQAENFLSLTGMIILVLGGIGVSSVTRVFIEQKRKSIAVLKCVGATGRKITSAYLLQIVLLGIVGSVVGIALAKVILVVLGFYYATNLPPGMSYGLQSGAVLQGFGFGLLVTLLFSALPLLRIRNIKPNVLLRELTADQSSDGSTQKRSWIKRIRNRQFDSLRWGTAILVSIGLVLLSSWQAGSLRVGMFFLSGFFITAAILNLAARLLIYVVRRSKRIAAFQVRHAISSLHRPGNQTHVIVMAVGLGAFFIIATQAIQTNLLREMDFENRSNLPNMYLIDIQSDQKEGVEKIIREATTGKPLILPTVRARISAINGKQIDSESEEYKKDRGRLGFEYTLTYRDHLEPTETILSGKFWGPASSSQPEVSIEEGLQGMMGLDVGGTITFDILGRKITSKVTSIRRVDWKNARTGFYVVFRPGVLEKAPNVYIAALDAPMQEPARSRFQQNLTDRYPNVTAIDVADIVRNLRKVLRTVTIAISFIGGFVLGSGVLILIGSIAMTKFQRIYEAAVLKTLGAKRKLVLIIFLIEYALLGAVAGVLGSATASALSYAISKHVFELNWEWTPAVYLLGTAATIILVTAVGCLSSFDVLQKKPLKVLRAQ